AGEAAHAELVWFGPAVGVRAPAAQGALEVAAGAQDIAGRQPLDRLQPDPVDADQGHHGGRCAHQAPGEARDSVEALIRRATEEVEAGQALKPAGLVARGPVHGRPSYGDAGSV